MKANSFGRVFKPICSIVRARERERGGRGKKEPQNATTIFKLISNVGKEGQEGGNKRGMRGKINTATSAANGILIN